MTSLPILSSPQLSGKKPIPVVSPSVPLIKSGSVSNGSSEDVLRSTKSGLSFVVCDPEDECIVVPVPSGDIVAHYTTTRELRIRWERPPQTALLVKRIGDSEATGRLVACAKCEIAITFNGWQLIYRGFSGGYKSVVCV